MSQPVDNVLKKYQIIYADPPWEYKVWTAKFNLSQNIQEANNSQARVCYLKKDVNRIVEDMNYINNKLKEGLK